MRWRRGPRSEHLKDERGAPARGGGAGLSIPDGVGKVGLPVVVVAVIVIILLNVLGGGGTGFDVPGLDSFNQAPAGGGGTGIPRSEDPDADLVDFVSFVLDDVQATWEQVFRAAGDTYPEADLVLFEGSTDTGCGSATSAVGPFYCPADKTAYLDLDFFRELRSRFGAPGDFAQAYVIAHELGHHVQNVLGISGRVEGLSREHPEDQNELSIRLELQADCLAGVWGFTANERGILIPGDLQEGLEAAASVGDDRIQKEATGRINPDTWTHGSSEQRVSWFSKGFDSGDADQCDTFSGDI